MPTDHYVGSPQNVKPLTIEIPPDPRWQPTPLQLPACFLEESSYQPAEPERQRWKATRARLPLGRRRRISKCGTFALHLSKKTASGPLESVHPTSCMDKVACPYCATRYAAAAEAERGSKFTILCQAHSAPLLVVEARAVIPAWLSAVRAPGCELAEERAKLCRPGARCASCDVARVEHAEAARIEAELHAGLTAAWSRLSPGSGGLYTTTIEQTGPHAPIALVVRLMVPALAVRIVGLEAHNAPFICPDFTALQQSWKKTAEKFQATEFSLSGGMGRTPDEIARILHAAHIPPIAALDALLAAGVHVPPEALSTFLRAAGLAVDTKTGRTRRCQRAAWFGSLAARHRKRTLAAYGLEVIKPETHATVEILDHYRVLGVHDDAIDVQSTRTAVKKTIPRALCRLSAYVDPSGAPLTAPDAPQWARLGLEGRRGEELRAFAARLGASSGDIRIPRLRSAREHQRAQQDLWGPLIRIVPTSAELADGTAAGIVGAPL